MSTDDIMALAESFGLAYHRSLKDPSLETAKQCLAKQKALLKAVEQLAADATRYRWLFSARTEDECKDQTTVGTPPLPQDQVIGYLAGFYAEKAHVDEIVDAAMKGETP